MKRRNLTAGVIAFGACLVIADVSTPSARLYAAEPQSLGHIAHLQRPVRELPPEWRRGLREKRTRPHHL
jgi:hypothetical protein